MTIYMSRLFSKSNSSILLSTGKAIQAQVSRIRDDMLLVDAGISTPKITPPEELTSIPTNPTTTNFPTTVGFLPPSAPETPIKTQLLERMFVDMVAGEPEMKDRAVARFNDLVGSGGGAGSEAGVMLPRRFRQEQAWNELKKKCRLNKKVRGFPVEKVRGGYSVAVAGYVAFLPFRSFMGKNRAFNGMFNVEDINVKRKKITVS